MSDAAIVLRLRELLGSLAIRDRHWSAAATRFRVRLASGRACTLRLFAACTTISAPAARNSEARAYRFRRVFPRHAVPTRAVASGDKASMGLFCRLISRLR